MPGNERLRQQRMARNWSQQEAADRLGVALVTFQRWERGSQQPRGYYRVKLSALFGLSVQELGLIEGPLPSVPAEREARDAAQPDVALSKETALWTVPYARNPHFTGRDDLLTQLAQQFSSQEVGQSSNMRLAALTQSYAIKGLGGVGKTQIAVEYAYRSHEQGRYTHTIWINAASEEAMLTSFATLADSLPDFASYSETDQRKLVTALIRWLEQCEQPWLLIVDNADDLSFVPAYLPMRGNGSILFTTRASAVGSLASSIEVDCMGLMEATHLLLRRAQREASASEDEVDEATNIAVALAQFPLALDQAGAYIEETGCSLRDYLQLYQQHRYTLLARRGKQTWRYPESVATTWSLSFWRIQQANPAAAELLQLCAFLAPDHIPQELLTEGTAYWPAALQQAVADPLTFNQVLETLLAFSLVKRLGEDQQLSVHRLVQVVQMERLSSEEQRKWAERVIYAVNAIFPRNPQYNVASWPLCLRYLEQVQACDALIQHHQLLLTEGADVLNRAGAYLENCALHALAKQLYQRALHIWEQQLGPEHPKVASPLDNLANIYVDQGQYAEAEPLFQRALRIREHQLGPEHVDLASPLNNLGNLYCIQSKYAEAGPLYQRALHIWEQQLGPQHPEVASPLNGLGNIYMELGQYAQAEVCYRRAISIRELLGPEHPRVASPLNNLGSLYTVLGKYAEAEPLLHRAWRIWEQHLGPEHPLVAHPINGLAELYSEQGKYAEAEPLYQRAWRIWEQQLGPEHADLASPLNGLANLYTAQGRYGKAEPLFQRALRIRKQQLGAQHPETATTMHDLARYWEARGNREEACACYTHALAIRDQALGAQHPKTMQTRKQLSEILHAMGQHEQATQLEAVGSEL